MPDDPLAQMSKEQIEEYVQATGKIASAVESLMRQDGWQIFLALYDREKRRIKDKDDYDSLEDFKADRAAIGIVESILDTFKGYTQDATDAAALLSGISPDESPPSRGIMLIEAAEGGSIEA